MCAGTASVSFCPRVEEDKAVASLRRFSSCDEDLHIFSVRKEKLLQPSNKGMT